MARTKYPFIQENVFGRDETMIVVSTAGSDTTGYGSWASPVKTLTKALSLVTTTRATIYAMRGEYEEADMLTWPSISNVLIIGLGDVVVSAPTTTAAVITINPTVTGTFVAGMENISVAHSGDGSTQKGIEINNTNQTATKKMIISLDRVGVEFDDDGTGDSISVTGGQAANVIRLYMSNCDEIEGLLDFAVTNPDDVITIKDCALMGGLTTTGQDGYLLLSNTMILASGLTMTVTNHSYAHCFYRAVTEEGSYTYTTLADSFYGS
jgi:hypothetical protein